MGDNAPGRPRKLYRRLTAVAATVFAVSLGAPVTYALLSGNDLAIPGAAAASAFVNELAGRSPGARTHADLIKTKKRPTSRMLSAAVLPKDNPIFAQAPAGFIDIVYPVVPITEDILPIMSGPLFAAESLPIGGAGPGGGIGILPPGGGGGIVTPPGTETPPGPPAVSPVPEPGTWAMMLLGFMLMGSARAGLVRRHAHRPCRRPCRIRVEGRAWRLAARGRA